MRQQLARRPVPSQLGKALTIEYQSEPEQACNQKSKVTVA